MAVFPRVLNGQVGVGVLVSPVVTSLLFFVVFTPFALILGMAGKDLLRLQRDPGAASYWIEQNPPGPPPQQF